VPHSLHPDDAGRNRTAGATGAVAGLCPITESSLGDGIFDGLRYVGAGGKFGVGSDSNIRISLAEELRTLEYSQRLRDRGRAMLATPEKSTGRVLFDGACAGGAQAAGRLSGVIEPGMYADLLALDAGHPTSRAGLATCCSTASSSPGTPRWSATCGQPGGTVVREGRHVAREASRPLTPIPSRSFMDII
jgi:formimidoylglutamate deiminase